MVWSSGKMGRSNEGMWNSSTHAMSDISALAYRRNVPACEVIVPADVGASDDTFEPTRGQTVFQSTFADVSWNMVGCGRGRGALLQNRDVLHRNDQELKKQLRIANGLGYSNDLIEARFQNSSPTLSQDCEETGDRVEPDSFYNDDDLSLSPCRNKGKSSPESSAEDSKKTGDEEDDDDDLSVNENGEWNWEKRTVTPPPNRVILRNVALESLKRRQLKAKSTEKNVSQAVPIVPGREECAPSAWAMPKVKENWRAENRAMEEARQAGDVGVGTTTAAHSPIPETYFQGRRKKAGEPLLGDLKVDKNWSIFAPSVSPPIQVAEDNYLPEFPAPEPGQQTVVESPPVGLLESVFDLPQKANKKKKKKGQNVRNYYVPPPMRSNVEPSVAPAGYLMPTNGVSPMAIRNSEYNPLVGQNIHRTFGNMFEQLGTHRPCKRGGHEFNLTSEAFPQLN